MSARLRRLGATSTAKTAVERWLSEANLWLEEFYAERTKSPRQSLNKVFTAWKALVAVLPQLASELDPVLREELRRRGFTEDGAVKVTTATAPKIIHLVAEKAEQEPVRELAQSLLSLHKDAYILHTAFYEGPEHAGFTGTEEALETAIRLAEKLQEVAGRLQDLVRNPRLKRDITNS